VDDNNAARMVLYDILQSFSCKVGLAASGEECLAEVERAAMAGEEYGLILMDWKMPGLDGLATWKRIASLLSEEERPVVIMVTAYGHESLRVEAEEAGVRGFLVKPVTSSALFDALVSALCLEKGTEDHSPDGVPELLPQGVDMRGKRVLVVEDNAINQQVATELLASWNVLTDVASDGAEALTMVQERTYSAVLMDVQMPVLDGLAATRAIRALGGAMESLPIIAMTAHAMERDRQESLRAGMNDHVTKPLDPDKLRQVLAKWLALEGPQEEGGEQGFPEISGLDTGNALRRMGGNATLYRKLLDEFVTQNRTVVREIGAMLARGDEETARRTAHTLKGVSGNVGAVEVHEAARLVEKAIRDGAEHEELLARLEQSLAVVLGEIEKGLAELPAGEEPPPPAGAADRGDLVSQLKEIRELAMVHDMDAEEHFAGVHGALQERCPEEAERLGACFAGLDFEEAVRVIDGILAGMAQGGEG